MEDIGWTTEDVLLYLCLPNLKNTIFHNWPIEVLLERATVYLEDVESGIKRPPSRKNSLAHKNMRVFASIHKRNVDDIHAIDLLPDILRLFGPGPTLYSLTQQQAERLYSTLLEELRNGNS